MRIAIPDLGLLLVNQDPVGGSEVSAGTTICVSETATERIAEGNMFPPKSSTISNVVCSLL